MGVIRECYPQCDICHWTNFDAARSTVREVMQNLSDTFFHRVGNFLVCDECFEAGRHKSPSVSLTD